MSRYPAITIIGNIGKNFQQRSRLIKYEGSGGHLFSEHFDFQVSRKKNDSKFWQSSRDLLEERVSIGRFLRPAEVRKSGPSMVTEILLPTFRRVIPVCRTLESFPTGNARVHWLANLTRRGEGGRVGGGGGGGKRKNSKVEFSRDHVHTFSSLLILPRLEVGHFANFSTLPLLEHESTNFHVFWRLSSCPRVRTYWMEKRRSLSKQFESISVAQPMDIS